MLGICTCRYWVNKAVAIGSCSSSILSGSASQRFSQVGVRARYYSDNHEDAVLMTTPPLRSSAFRRLISERVADLRARWGEGYPLAGHADWSSDATPSG